MLYSKRHYTDLLEFMAGQYNGLFNEGIDWKRDYSGELHRINHLVAYLGYHFSIDNKLFNQAKYDSYWMKLTNQVNYKTA